MLSAFGRSFPYLEAKEPSPEAEGLRGKRTTGRRDGERKNVTESPPCSETKLGPPVRLAW